MNAIEWLAATSPHEPGITSGERLRRQLERKRVIAKAKTSMSSIRNGSSRGSFGLGLVKRLEAATAGERAEIKVLDQFPELAEDFD